MLRLFDLHQVRPLVELEGLWDFEPLADEAGLPRRYRFKLAVPGTWESHPAFATYRGRGAYRRLVTVPEDGTVRLYFYGVSHTADVYWDGQHVGHHYDAHTGFPVVLPAVGKGQHELIVIADNRFTEQSTLHIPNDYYTYGGITRPISLATVPKTFLESVRFTAVENGGRWEAEVAAAVQGLGGDAVDARVVVSLAGERTELTSDPGPDEHQLRWYRGRFPCPGIKPWSPADPVLYLLSAELFEFGGIRPVDDLRERVGFRTVEWDREGLRINGEPTRVEGFNRHEDHPAVGSAVPLSLMIRDLELLRDLGANAVRTSHYPNDERFLDACDELGILVWEEHHARGLDLERMLRPGFREQIAKATREMVSQHQTHPAIIVWGVFNECASDQEAARPLYRQCIGIIRSLDPSRSVTYASHRRDRDRFLDLVDVIAFNLYPGWYTDEDPADLFRTARRWADAAGGESKPLIISEMGADGFYGVRQADGGYGSEERQAEVLAADIKAARSVGVAGFFVWQFADCRVSAEDGWGLRRPTGQNVKGVVDGYRRPKAAYRVVRSLLSDPSRQVREPSGRPSGTEVQPG